MTHRRAVALMILVSLLWSLGGIVTRQLDAARSFEVTFWRSLFCVLALTLALGIMRGRALWQRIAHGGWPLWVSGVCWSVMFTAYMVAMTLTSVANVLLALATCPLLTALCARVVLKHRLPTHTWLAIFAAGAGIAWMFSGELGQGTSLLGTLVAFAPPLGSAINWTVLQSVARRDTKGTARQADDMLPAVLIGAALSALATLPLALPLQASPHDLSWLASLGFVQLAIPCLLVVRVSRDLSAPEIALLGLLEVIFGVTWAWLGAGEQPAPSTLTGGMLVIGALLANELAVLRHAPRAARALSARSTV